jgi:hypothetical protein
MKQPPRAEKAPMARSQRIVDALNEIQPLKFVQDDRWVDG